MSDSIVAASLSDVGNAQRDIGASEQLNTNNAFDQQRGNAEDFMRVALSAVEIAAVRPNHSGQMTGEIEEISGDLSGSVGGLKADMTPAGKAEGSDNSDALQRAVEDRTVNMYVELTHYNIAWKIAQRLQQDITQVIRG